MEREIDSCYSIRLASIR